jgi:hypothetical protein
MRRDQLEHAIRTACQIIGKPAVIVVGSLCVAKLCAFRESASRPPAHIRSSRPRLLRPFPGVSPAVGGHDVGAG